jgi:small subunit ribosomal protein S20e
MSYVTKGEEGYDAASPVPPTKLHRIRITLTSSNALKSVRVSRSLSLVLFF